jgi:hypothetical protein
MTRSLNSAQRTEAPRPEAADKTTTPARIALPALIPITKSAEFLGWSRATSYRLAAEGKLRLRKIGAATFVESASAVAHIEHAPTLVPRSAR